MRVPHQLSIHLDYTPSHDIEIRWSYPHSAPHAVREQVLRLTRERIPLDIKRDLDELRDALSSRISAPPVRLPHCTADPVIRWANMTIVVQDARRNDELPLARMCYIEAITELESQIEREIRMAAGSFSRDERAAWERLRSRIKAIAWHDYHARFVEQRRST